MSESNQTNQWIQLAGAVIAGAALSYLLQSTTRRKSDSKAPLEEAKKPRKNSLGEGLDLSKERTFTMRKIEKLKEGSSKFIEGLTNLSEVAISRVPHLAETHDCDVYTSPLLGDASQRDIAGKGTTGFLPDEAFSSVKKFVLSGKSYQCYEDIARELKFLRAGPRKQIFWNPKEVKAAIVTCGGLCPGLNVVIRELVMTLWFNYGVKDIFGVKWGYQGFHKASNIIKLTPKIVKRIHNEGGTFLGSSRGGFDEKVIIDICKEKGINHLYIIGGDGTHRGIYKLYEYATENKERISICGIPKTIDNDIPLIDKSFGFDTAVAVAEQIISCANNEAESAEFGVGMVKLMGRDSGEIAAAAAQASRDVNICLIPESPFEVEGEYGLCETVCQRIISKNHCTIVVAEGADDAIIDANLAKEGKADAGGHVKHADIGTYLKNKIVAYAKENYDINITLKYIDPTYTIRSVSANAGDTIICTKLAQNSVHAAMAGYTGFSIGTVKDTTAIIPIKSINNSAKRKMDLNERTWQRVIASTGQPQMVCPENMEKITEKVQEYALEKQKKHQKLIEEQVVMSEVILEAFDTQENAEGDEENDS
ncbi:unnamed protein product [Moneuplotes crassus]|uniref:Phosphofructokinase domain-containing protein n=1 Tax=Euplotes crassus TaxID=5936 RepID=A0AAD1XA44_EUPCR|nr:unnamed protein product [Moneuplotes crassus]